VQQGDKKVVLLGDLSKRERVREKKNTKLLCGRKRCSIQTKKAKTKKGSPTVGSFMDQDKKKKKGKKEWMNLFY